MPKYAAYVKYISNGYLEVEADTEEQALELAYEQAENAETTGYDHYEVKVEEIE